MSHRSDRTEKDTGAGQPAQRIDKWLWHARFARTRTAAQQLVLSGKVRINRRRIATASRPVKAGDVLTLVIGKTVRVIEVLEIAARRGSPAIARSLYEDRAPPITPTAVKPADKPDNGNIGGKGRPGKRDRQQILALKRKQF
jgi:ribosome-associated heat shock protein Hsp15